MASPYNEDELLLRLLVGLVYPLLVLVALRLTRHGLRGWEGRWRPPATRWLQGLLARTRLASPEKGAKRGVRVLLGLERTVAFGLAVLALSLTWFMLFPQTRSLGLELLRSIVAPLLEVGATVLRGILLVLYSVGIFVAAFLSTRALAVRSRAPGRDRGMGLALYAVPARIGIWLVAVFLFLLPYPGLPRILAMGLLLLVLLLVVLGLRPLVEEALAGAYLQSTLGLRRGSTLRVEGVPYAVADLGPLHATLLREGETVRLPYSRIMKSALTTEEGRDDGGA